MTELLYVDVLNKFNGDISKWDAPNVAEMYRMFAKSKFNQDISKWDVSNVKAPHYGNMFEGCPLEKKPEFKPIFLKTN